MHIVVAASFTADPCKPYLLQAGSLLWSDVTVQVAGFGQVIQNLVNAAGMFYANKQGVNLIYCRSRDLPFREEFIRALSTYDASYCGPLCVCLCPELTALYDESSFLKESFQKVIFVKAIDFFDVDSKDFDMDGDQAGAMPYSVRIYNCLGYLGCRLASYACRTPFKVICVDCDQTLWSGIVGEDGPEALVGNEGLMRCLKQSVSNGIVLVTCSKNIATDVRAAFDSHKKWPLAYDDFLMHKESWESKGKSIQECASELGLSGFESFFFIDDNPVEISSVLDVCPGISTLQWPQDTEVHELYARNVWPLDTLRSTQEDKLKTNMYRKEFERRVASVGMTHTEFIASLQVNIRISKMQNVELDRVLQLTQKTNQFNFTTERLSAIPEHDEVQVVHVSDKYGDYGLVGVIIYSIAGSCLTLQNLLMSCRVLGRGVEAAMLRNVGTLAHSRGVEHVRIQFVHSERNEPARIFLIKHGMLDPERLFAPHALVSVTFDPAEETAKKTVVSTVAKDVASHLTHDAYQRLALLGWKLCRAFLPEESVEFGLHESTGMQRILASIRSVTGVQLRPEDQLRRSGIDSVSSILLMRELKTIFHDFKVGLPGARRSSIETAGANL